MSRANDREPGPGRSARRCHQRRGGAQPRARGVSSWQTSTDPSSCLGMGPGGADCGCVRRRTRRHGSSFLLSLAWLLVAQTKTADALVVGRGGGGMVPSWRIQTTTHRWIAVRAEGGDGDADGEYKGERLAKTEETLTAAGAFRLPRPPSLPCSHIQR